MGERRLRIITPSEGADQAYGARGRMLFNTSEFVFIFLGLAVGLHFLAARRSVTAAAIVTTLSSLAFYGWGSPPFVLLPALSIVLNFLLGHAIATSSDATARRLML